MVGVTLLLDKMIKTCTRCKTEKDVSDYPNRGGKQTHLFKSHCKTCRHKEHRNWAIKNPDRVSEYREKDPWTLIKRCARYDITPEQLADRYERQERCCAICKTEILLAGSAIDHNHATGEFRGVLCKLCNRALGMFQDSTEVLLNAVEYLEAFGSYNNQEQNALTSK